MSRKHLSRRVLRILAFQTLFQLEINPDMDVTRAILFSLNHHVKKVVSLEELETEYPEIDYTQTLVKGVLENKEEIDQKIAQYSIKWNLNRVVKMDLVILRLAIYEIQYLSEDVIPSTVAINEALEIAKQYSDEKSARFINGVLANML